MVLAGTRCAHWGMIGTLTGTDHNGLLNSIQTAKNCGYNSISVDFPPSEMRNVTAIKAGIKKAHDLGMTIRIAANFSKYAWEWDWDATAHKWERSYTFNTFHLKQHNPRSAMSATDLINPNLSNPNVPVNSEPIPYNSFIEEIDFILTNYATSTGIDGLELEEPYIHNIDSTATVAAAARTFYNNLFSLIRTKIGETRITAGFNYGFNHATHGSSVSSINSAHALMGTDDIYIKNHDVFTYFNIQNYGNTDEIVRDRDYLYGQVYPNLEIMNTFYITYSGLVRSTPGCDSLPNLAKCWNQAFFLQVIWALKNNKIHNIFLVERFDRPRSNFPTTSPSGATVGDILKTVNAQYPLQTCLPIVDFSIEVI